jgi:hypothetical protein
MTREQEIVWAAGFFDGEGSTFTSIRNDCRSMYLFAALCQNRVGDVLVVEFHAIVGVGKVYSNERQIQWRVWGYKDVSTVVELLRPYLHQPKLTQADYNHK